MTAAKKYRTAELICVAVLIVFIIVLIGAHIGGTQKTAAELGAPVKALLCPAKRGYAMLAVQLGAPEPQTADDAEAFLSYVEAHKDEIDAAYSDEDADHNEKPAEEKPAEKKPAAKKTAAKKTEE